MSAPVRSEEPRAPEQAAPPGAAPAPRSAWMAALLALFFPGLGHLLLGKRGRAGIFAVVILGAIACGALLHGNLWTPIEGRPLTWLATLGTMGMGLPYFVLRHVLAYAGDITTAGYEYGTAFLLGAGLMNLLLVLDAWDIGTGRKE